MNLVQLSSDHAHYYVPAFRVKLGGSDVVRQLLLAVNQVECDLCLNGPARFQFNIADAYDPKERDFFDGRGGRVLDLLTFGARIDIALGYGDHSNLTPMLSGIITEISTGFSESGSPDLTISGYDDLFTMMLGTQSRSWPNRTDSAVVSQIAGEHNLTPKIMPTTEAYPQIEQNQQSDLDFLKRLADRNHFQFYANPKRELRFGPPADNASSEATLAWGEGLLGFKPEANLAAQVSTVRVYGWDDQRKQVVVGEAVAGEESGRGDANRKSGGEFVRLATGRAAVLELRQPVFSAAEAKRRALAILNDHAKQYLTGEAECIGLPELRPDRNVTLTGLGRMFSKTYYMERVVHKVDSGGYRTRLKVKEPS